MPKRIPRLIDPRTKTRPREARPSACRRGYDRKWQAVRERQLARQPFCQDCLDGGRHAAATEVDHVQTLASGGSHAEENLRSLCKSCHSRKTTAVDGGLGRAKQQGGHP